MLSFRQRFPLHIAEVSPTGRLPGRSPVTGRVRECRPAVPVRMLASGRAVVPAAEPAPRIPATFCIRVGSRAVAAREEVSKSSSGLWPVRRKPVVGAVDECSPRTARRTAVRGWVGCAIEDRAAGS